MKKLLLIALAFCVVSCSREKEPYSSGYDSWNPLPAIPPKNPKMDSIVGFQFGESFNGSGDKNERKLERPFRGFYKAKTSYTNRNRLYEILMMPSDNKTDYSRWTNEDIVEEVKNIAKLMEDKYRIKLDIRYQDELSASDEDSLIWCYYKNDNMELSLTGHTNGVSILARNIEVLGSDIKVTPPSDKDADVL